MRRKYQAAREIFVAYAMVGLITWHGLYQYALKALEKWPIINNMIYYR